MTTLGTTASQVLKIGFNEWWVHCYSTTPGLYSDPRQNHGYADVLVYSYFDASGETPVQGAAPPQWMELL